MATRQTEAQAMDMAGLAGKVVMVTGASSGLGRDFCVSLAAHGCHVVAAARRIHLLTDLLQQLDPEPVQADDDDDDEEEEEAAAVAAAGGGAKRRSSYHALVEVDVSSSDERLIDAAARRAWEAFGRIDALVNNAGVRGEVKMSLDLDGDEWNKVMNTNLRGLWLMSKAVAKRMRSANIAGSIINISSTSSLERGLLVGNSAYAASKAAVNQLTKVMAIELGKFNIRVNAIAAGVFKSEITEGLFAKAWVHEAAKKLVPLQRWGHVNPDLTSLVVFLVSDSLSYTTGNIFIVDGGYSIPGVPLWSSL